MPKAGQVRIRLTRDMALATADWLRWYGDQEGSTNLETASALAAKLWKVARRRRPAKPFITLIDREHAAFLSRHYQLFAITRRSPMTTAPGLAMDAMRACSQALAQRRGRHRLSLDELEAQEAGEDGHNRGSEDDGGRNKRRLVRNVNHERAWREFTESGKSILGSIEDVPKK